MDAGQRNVLAARSCTHANTTRATTLAQTRVLVPLAATVLISGSLTLGAHAAHAAQATGRLASQPLFAVAGNAVEVATPQDYHSATVQSFEIATFVQQHTNLRYFVLSGTLVNGQYHYPLRVDMERGVAAEGTEVAMDAVAHKEVVAIGTPYSVCGTCGGGGPMAQATLHLTWYALGSAEVRVFDYLGWNYNGSQVTWYTANSPRSIVDGPWYTKSETHGSGYANSNTLAYAEIHGTYDNSAGNGVIYVSPSRVYGDANGGRSTDINSWVTGICGLCSWSYTWD
ncbi:MAG: hypothetical protein ACHQ4H_10540 [Ktedonobacterales bacterium]